MFYSHEILFSPEHGVATIWLAATLGTRSITKRLNKKAILDVDVPRACNVITNPEAPMALRLQGSLLYGVSRVYSQQCRYTLTDVQAMHDTMRTMLNVLPGGGLDPGAGKTKPEQLILQDDPSFVPEINLPGLDIDISALTLEPQANIRRQSSFLLTKLPDLSQTLPESFNLQLDLSSDDVLRDLGDFGSKYGNSGSAQRKDPLRRISASALDDEAGVLLQPDFEFDEDGSIIEFSHERRPADGRQISETPRPGEMGNDLSLDYQPMSVDDGDHNIHPRNDPATPNAQQSARPGLPPDTPLENGNVPEDNSSGTQQVTVRQSRKITKAVPVDEQTALRNTELAHINNEYLQNMAIMTKQRLQNKLPAQAKRNAAFWVLDQGIGSVGVGLGASRMLHPLHLFSGAELFASLHPEVEKSKRKAKKRGRSQNEGEDESGSDSDGRRVRARGESEEQVMRGGGPTVHGDIEIGRRASSALRDDHSSQMPWNITASIQSSRHGSSAANIFRGTGSVSDFSSRGMSDSASMHLGVFGGPRSRLTSASPLAGRGFPFDLDALNGIEGDNDVYGDFDLSNYLQTEVDGDGNVTVRDDEGTADPASQGRARMKKSGNLESQLRFTQDQVLQSSLDQESVNFLDFMYAEIIDLSQQEKDDDDVDVKMADVSTPPRQTSGPKEILFSSLLAPKETTRTVATHALMHILTLATKGFVEVHQDGYQDLSNDDYGTLYQFGEIHVRLLGM